MFFQVPWGRFEQGGISKLETVGGYAGVMNILNRTGEAISSIEQWTPPKKKIHWKPGRSAMELARAWCPASGPACPADIATLLSSHDWTRNIQIEETRPEHVTPLPERGEGRNHDLWAKCSVDGRPFTLCIEAKADEPFGETIGDTCASALKRSEATGGVRRARALLHMVFGTEAEPDREPYASLRYQLLTAAAGTALQSRADGALTAALVIHEFQGASTSAPLLQRNAEDLAVFLKVLNGGEEVALTQGRFAGPWAVRAGSAADSVVIQLLVGKVVTRLSESL
ncbi:MAG: hypothetical protein ABIP18_11660 [Steroidobacteraceae bacterium]